MNAPIASIKNYIRFAPLLAVIMATLPLLGCGGSGAAAAIAEPLPVATPAPIATPDTDKGTDAPIPAESPLAPVPPSGNALFQIAQQAEENINAERLANGLPTLKHSNALQAVAQAYAERMAIEGFFSHYDATGKRVSDRVNAIGYTRWSLVGENLAWVQTEPGNEAAYATQGWMNSTTHRANILNKQFTDGAIGVAKASDGKCYLVQVFSHPY